MKHLIPLSILTLALVACTDTTGLSADSNKGPHPESNENAAVTVVEYGDLQCPACRSAQALVVAPLLEQYGGQVRFEFRQFPLASIHQFAMEAAEASECAADQGKFWEFIDLSYAEQEKLNRNQISTWGTQLGLDMDLFERCRSSHIKRDVVQADYTEGKGLGVNGTPTFFVNGEQVPSTIEDIGNAIKAKIGDAGARL